MHRLLFLLLFHYVFAQSPIDHSGGKLMPEQAAYDVSFYDLALDINPADSSISGKLIVSAKLDQPIDWFVLDLDTLLQINQIVEVRGAVIKNRDFERKVGKVWIDLNGVRNPGEKIKLEVHYGGKPRIAPRPPWRSGFTWSKTKSGKDWIITSSWGGGADLWWPCKDHISDSPDSMRLSITVPKGLQVAANGTLRKITENNNATSTFHWFISNPIDIQNVALSVGPYKLIEDIFKSNYGYSFPIQLYVLEDDYEKGLKFFPQIAEHLNFYEELLGPYPFRAEKYGVVQSIIRGMEHQTIIAIDSTLESDEKWGFHATHLHELAHEWWGNKVTNFDWCDMWLHEGFATYMEPLFVEKNEGYDGYIKYLLQFRKFWNYYTLAPRKPMTTQEIYTAPIYAKGAWILHTLRFLAGDETFFKTLKLFAYPNGIENLEGADTRFVTTDDFKQLAEATSGKNLDWFFEVYLSQPYLPMLKEKVENQKLHLEWIVPGNIDFKMPIEIEINGEVKTYHFSHNKLSLTIPDQAVYKIDPLKKILYREAMPPVISLNSTQLEKYVGEYRYNNGWSVSINKVNDQLDLIDDWADLRMFPINQKLFLFKEAEDAKLEFRFNNLQEVDSLIYYGLRGTYPFKKVSE